MTDQGMQELAGFMLRKQCKLGLCSMQELAGFMLHKP